MTPQPFELAGPLPEGLVVLEASAGTGKTYAIAALVARYVAEGRARLQDLLVVTFTRAATGELRDRVRERLVAIADELDRAVDGRPVGGNEVTALLVTGDPAEVLARRDRLRHALADFDAATIATTHGFCEEALASLGIDSRSVRAGKKYTKEVIIQRLQGAARAGSDLLSVSLAKVLDLKAVNREFGTLAKALLAAGLAERLRMRRHGGTKWTHERVIAALRERAARNVHTLTPGLHRVVQLYFGGAREARMAAGVPDPVDVAIERRRREKAAFQARHRRPATRAPRR